MSDERNPDPGDDELLLDEPEETETDEFETEDLVEPDDDEDVEDDDADDDEPVVEARRPRTRAEMEAEREAERYQHRQFVENQIRDAIPRRAEQLREQFGKIVEASWEQQEAHWRKQAENEATMELFKIREAADMEHFRKYLRSKGLSKQHAKETEDLLAQQRRAGNWGLGREVVSKYILGNRAVEGGARAAPGRASRRGNGRGKLTSSDMALLRRMRVKDLG